MAGQSESGGEEAAGSGTPALLPDESASPASLARRERFVRDKFWPKLKRVIAAIPFVDDLLAAYYCALDPQTPVKVRGILLAALVYFIVPLDFIPDIILSLGFTDDATVLAMAMGMVGAHIKDRHRQKAAEALGKEFPQYAEKSEGGNDS